MMESTERVRNFSAQTSNPALAQKILYALVINGPGTPGQVAGELRKHRNDRPFHRVFNELKTTNAIYSYAQDGHEEWWAMQGWTRPYIPRTLEQRAKDFCYGSYTKPNEVTWKQTRYPPAFAVKGTTIIQPFVVAPPAAAASGGPANPLN